MIVDTRFDRTRKYVVAQIRDKQDIITKLKSEVEALQAVEALMINVDCATNSGTKP